jgi:hypothetical protein
MVSELFGDKSMILCKTSRTSVFTQKNTLVALC